MAETNSGRTGCLRDPNKGAACHGGWPGDAIDRIDAINEVGRGGAMLNAE